MRNLFIILISSVLLVSFVEIDENQININNSQEKVSLEEGEALLYVIRPKDLFYAEPYVILCDTVHLGTFRVKTCYYFTIPEGKYKLRSPKAKRKNREIDAIFEAGKTYYIEIAQNASLSFIENKKTIDKYLKKYENNNERIELANGITKYK